MIRQYRTCSLSRKQYRIWSEQIARSKEFRPLFSFWNNFFLLGLYQVNWFRKSQCVEIEEMVKFEWQKACTTNSHGSITIWTSWDSRINQVRCGSKWIFLFCRICAKHIFSRHLSLLSSSVPLIWYDQMISRAKFARFLAKRKVSSKGRPLLLLTLKWFSRFYHFFIIVMTLFVCLLAFVQMYTYFRWNIFLDICIASRLCSAWLQVEFILRQNKYDSNVSSWTRSMAHTRVARVNYSEEWTFVFSHECLSYHKRMSSNSIENIRHMTWANKLFLINRFRIELMSFLCPKWLGNCFITFE